MLASDLTVPSAVQAYLGSAGSDTDTIGMLISAVSRNVLSFTGRDSFISKAYDEIRDGTGTPSLILRRWPVTAVSFVGIYGQQILAGSNINLSPTTVLSPFASSYMFSAWDGDLPGSLGRVDLRSGVFVRDHQNIEVKYQAGYAVTEVQTPSANLQVTPFSPAGRWCQDGGVSYVSSKTLLTPVASSPAVGQYVPPKLGGTNFYLFNTGDQVAMSLTYSFIPSDIELAVIMQVSELLRYRTRVGEKSRSLGGQEVASYLVEDFHPAVKTALRPYIHNAKSLIR